MLKQNAFQVFAAVACMVGTCNGAMDTSIDQRSARPDGTETPADTQVITDHQKALPPSDRAPTRLLAAEAEPGR